jgi:hypothetical protein
MKKKVRTSLGCLEKEPYIRRSTRTTPSVYGQVGGGGAENLAPKRLLKRKKMNMSSPMRGLFWNCRGISKKGFSPYIRDTIKDHKFDFLCFQETMVEDFSNSCFR